MATEPSAPSNDAPSGGPRPEKRGTEAVRIAEREVRLAQQAVKEAKDLGSEEALQAAKDRLKEAQAALRRLRKPDSAEGRREARDDFMDDYFARLGPEVANLVRTDPELRRLFDEATRKGWKADVFMSELRKTDWWNDPKKGFSWREAFRMEFQTSPGEWAESLEVAKNKIRDLADDLYGIDVPDDILNRIARRYYYQGWSKDDRGLRSWLARQFRTQSRDEKAPVSAGGLLLAQERALTEAVRAYGVERDSKWISQTARKILNPQANFDEDDAWNEIIAEAESLYPVFAGKLSKDRSVRDLGAGYINQLYRRLELASPDEVDLMDPLLRRAFTTPNDKGEPALMPLWQFEQEIKKDDRWQLTNNARDTYMNAGTSLLRAFGFAS